MKKIILILLPIIIFSCGTKNESIITENEKEIIKAELQSIMNQMIQNNEIGNLEKSIEPYLDYPEFISITNGQISNYSELRSAHEQYFEVLKSQEFTESTFVYNFLNSENVIVTWGCTALVEMKNEQKTILKKDSENLVN